jgi:membrane protein
MTTSGTSKSSRHWTMPTGLRRRWLVAPLDIFRSFRDHECYFLAASVSFYFMLSLVPMLFLFLAVIGYFLRDTTTVRADLTAAVHQYVPFLTEEIIDNIEQVVQNPGLLGWIGGAGLFLSTDLVFVAVQTSLDRIFVPSRRGFFRSKMLSVLLGVIVFCVVLLTIAVNAVDTSLERLVARTPELGGMPVGLHLSTWTIGLLLFGSFTLAIRILPHTEVPTRHAIWGGAVGAAVWLLVKSGYVWYLQNVSKVGPLFGSLSAVVLTLVWVYVSTLAFLAGAELTRWLIITEPGEGSGGQAESG